MTVPTPTALRRGTHPISKRGVGTSFEQQSQGPDVSVVARSPQRRTAAVVEGVWVGSFGKQKFYEVFVTLRRGFADAGVPAAVCAEKEGRGHDDYRWSG